MSAAIFKMGPEAFMRENIILAGRVTDVENLQDGSSVRIFRIEAAPGSRVSNRPHGNVYYLEFDATALPFDPLPDQIAAYWCPYRDDHQLGTMLGHTASYMFTAVMDGCSFGIGSALADGSRAVFHANKKGVGTGANAGSRSSIESHLNLQVKAQKKALKAMFVPKQNIISPAVYAGGVVKGTHTDPNVFTMKYKSTTVGLRSTAGWTFHTLKYRYLGGGAYEHGGFDQFVPLP